MKSKLQWEFYKGDHIQADLMCAGPYVISCRTNRYILSYRPPGEHIHLGEYLSLDFAIYAAEVHYEK